ncbi:uncharacterized protein LOC109813261 isoform X1 [Cajanus cajan]|uniref:uncharacterized protein LOC109813261 isoform X1 n=1 Tax=Cajanus cajan TaxID=3821 RepID=UPI00098DA84D|nr:uncharacterized protein LOC109813261 isoform X1 [Cajanus cajan]XP_029130193.1 uncharacterized protein LOC109813261 isoform X1 [Cajanus cajan]XP_029130194.1 uncharacterized protein LOC109813261 isoform X1 [Cajanus cajan]XP_029130195.1 uncharacterized protein LOC109813261 isoform X1 [Cajanus cajan]XP_029130196.1 uncharacterized protein LOC109813261 isoform X1 [Cajanus cajan]XP_029130197.1 uncharacterized protein LOC109813261 isoform X1 [Cajanus cajan]
MLYFLLRILCFLLLAFFLSPCNIYPLLLSLFAITECALCTVYFLLSILLHLLSWYQGLTIIFFPVSIFILLLWFCHFATMSDEVDPSLNIHSFLFLHPNENPTMALVSPSLDSTNYHSWSRSMLTTFSAKNKVEFVDGSAPQPPSSDRIYSAWKRCNNMVVSWLVHSVSSSIRQSILWMDFAEEIWRDLKSRYSQGDLLRISALQLEASSNKQGDLSVTDYFTQLRIIWDELENFRPDPICVCIVKCICKVSSILAQRKLEDQAMQFLRGLNDQYANVRSHVLLMDPLPPINKIFSYVAEQERQFFVSDSLADVKNGFANATIMNSTCNFCGRNGHTESTCYRKHGFLDKNGKSSSNRGKACSHCGKNGHTVDTCYKKHGFPPGHRFSNNNLHLLRVL